MKIDFKNLLVFDIETAPISKEFNDLPEALQIAWRYQAEHTVGQLLTTSRRHTSMELDCRQNSQRSSVFPLEVSSSQMDSQPRCESHPSLDTTKKKS